MESAFEDNNGFEIKSGPANCNIHQRDNLWFKEIRQGSKKSFQNLFRSYYNPLTRFAYRYVKSGFIAEEIVQDIFLKVWEKKEELEIEGKVRTYLFRSVHNRIMDYRRNEDTRDAYIREYAAQKNDSLQPENVEITEKSEIEREAEKAVEELPEKLKMTFKMNKVEGLTYQEIAEILNISPKTVESRMSKALDYLRSRLVKYLPVMILLTV